MINIKTLTQLTLSDMQRVASGYLSHKKYVVIHEENEDEVSFRLQSVILNQPFIKKWTYDEDYVNQYQAILGTGYSHGAYDGELLVGMAIAEAHQWNQSISVREFHVAEAYRHEGIGKRLMACVAAKAKQAGFRILVCETQNTNGDGIDIYRQLGFRMEGIDISYYTNNDYPDGEVAVFMKRKLRLK